jgi:predicted transcriptional regulator
MPDGSSAIPVSVRLPADLIEALDVIATAVERSRSWIIMRALRQYLADEGAEILDVQQGIAEADRGETVSVEEVLAEMRAKIANAKTSAG